MNYKRDHHEYICINQDKNAHPIFSNSKKLAIVHNGIIENYSSIKTKLCKEGFKFLTDTDTEVLINLIESIKIKNSCSLEEAIRNALKIVVGTYVILVLDEDNPDQLIAVRKGSPLVLGVGKGEHVLASDPAPIVEYTKNVVYVNDHELVIVCRDQMIMKNLDNEIINPTIENLDLEISEIEKGGYPYFMLKEIFEQPMAIENSMRGRIGIDNQSITLGGLKNIEDKLIGKERVILIACGTSWHAASIVSYYFQEYAKMSSCVEYASEFNYKETILTDKDIVIVISQSGETIDTLMSIQKAKQSQALTLGIVNVVGSSIAREVDAGCYCHAGPEVGVASTKAFTTQLVVLGLMCLKIALLNKKITSQKVKSILEYYRSLPKLTKKTLMHYKQIEKISKKYSHYKNFLFIARGVNYPVALEGALKLKEVSYLNAQGYPAGELKHGPIALIDDSIITFAIVTDDIWKEKTLSNVKEIKSRSGKIVLFVNEVNSHIKELADDICIIPKAHGCVSPILNVIPLQLIAYNIGVELGLDVDKPRNLAKSVTVE